MLPPAHAHDATSSERIEGTAPPSRWYLSIGSLSSSSSSELPELPSSSLPDVPASEPDSDRESESSFKTPVMAGPSPGSSGSGGVAMPPPQAAPHSRPRLQFCFTFLLGRVEDRGFSF